MLKINYTSKQKKRASTLMALGTSELEAAEKLVQEMLFREAVVHLYFTCFYVSQSLLCNKIASNPSHINLNRQLHQIYGQTKDFPRRYVELHTSLYQQRTKFNYKTTHTPNPDILKKQLAKLKAYVKFALKKVPRVEAIDILRSFHEDNTEKIRDFSFDIYCPKTYLHHTRLTFWQPPFYLKIFGIKEMVQHTAELLKKLKVRRHTDYVIGLNSKVNQYKNDHLIMLDIDSVNPAAEEALKEIGGIILKSGRGFHFIGRQVISGAKVWEKTIRKLATNSILKKYIDRKHIEISIQRGYSTLRVTAGSTKTTIPYFYKEI